MRGLGHWVVLATGIRQEEDASLEFPDIKKQNKRTVLNVQGKGAKDRVVPISDRLAEALIDWQFFVGPEGKVLGHASIKTTQEYLNVELDLEVTISDFAPF
jgi:site-specific recombinase XerD